MKMFTVIYILKAVNTNSFFFLKNLLMIEKSQKISKKRKKKTIAKIVKIVNRRFDDAISDSRKRKNIDFYDKFESFRKIRKNVIDLNAFDENYSDFEKMFRNKYSKKFVRQNWIFRKTIISNIKTFQKIYKSVWRFRKKNRNVKNHDDYEWKINERWNISIFSKKKQIFRFLLKKYSNFWT